MSGLQLAGCDHILTALCQLVCLEIRESAQWYISFVLILVRFLSRRLAFLKV